jgi:hypothetical protein
VSASKKAYAIDAKGRGVPMTVIARICGVSDTTVRRWTDPKYAAENVVYLADWKARNPEAQRRYDRQRQRGRCDSCHGPLGLGRTDGGTCARCWREELHFRRVDVQRLWNEEHLTSREIAAQMRMSKEAVEQLMVRMRRDGWTLESRK